MGVGGFIIELKPMTVVYADSRTEDVVRIWVMDVEFNEACVYAEIAAEMPTVGESIWWQSGKIYFRNNTIYLKKIGYSFAPKARERAS